MGKTPTAISKDLSEKRAGYWQRHQRRLYKNNVSAMTPERIAILEATPGWKWEEEDSWEPNRLHWIAQYQKLGITPTANSKDPEEKRAGYWQVGQRKAYKQKLSYMTDERIAKLEATEGWKWNDDDLWEKSRLH
ncbi:MAG: hypothetical protein EB127_31590, partial [Alphaproteobacteria bacterium]|nr:hypothetical protein [Alphaproteobacteria bacterium]